MIDIRMDRNFIYFSACYMTMHQSVRQLHPRISSEGCIQLVDSTELLTSDRETRNAVGFESRVSVTIRTISFQRSETSRNNVIVIRHRAKSLDLHSKNFSNKHFVSFRTLNVKLNYARQERDGQPGGNENIKIRTCFCIM